MYAVRERMGNEKKNNEMVYYRMGTLGYVDKYTVIYGTGDGKLIEYITIVITALTNRKKITEQ